ncbi:MAG: hypothetical protein AAGF24_10295 [Cyanobacteria bacterium P01_H01_bin.121]
MPRRQPKAAQPSTDTWDRVAFESSLTDLEQELQALRSRFDQVCRDLHRQQQLQQQLVSEQQDLKQADTLKSAEETLALQANLKHLQTDLNDLEIALESKLFSWRGFGDVFWQTVRFLGLGVILGWCLKALSGG